eukprot:CAMPEP_0178370074 /NCGR_PEP_ID=MMETSP0689_2-20121128/109_1 /TAXON_ID=160604 /ORGANISM="Amphidinium massartii, Strain CS-259" /LENGTH=157 /DNA_ID=CAMNT_0019989873 /DNA_START=82 /DNA_END=555 /DNA_ORIENTATION=+
MGWTLRISFAQFCSQSSSAFLRQLVKVSRENEHLCRTIVAFIQPMATHKWSMIALHARHSVEVEHLCFVLPMVVASSAASVGDETGFRCCLRAPHWQVNVPIQIVSEAVRPWQAELEHRSEWAQGSNASLLQAHVACNLPINFLGAVVVHVVTSPNV